MVFISGWMIHFFHASCMAAAVERSCAATHSEGDWLFVAEYRARTSTRTLASLCSRLIRAQCSLLTIAARMPGKRLAAMLMPMPLLQISTPRSKLPASNFPGDDERVLGIIHRLGGVRAEIGELIAVLRQPVFQRRFDLDAAMIARQGDAHRTVVIARAAANFPVRRLCAPPLWSGR